MEEVPEMEVVPGPESEPEPEPEPELEPEPKRRRKKPDPEPDPEPDLGPKKAGRPKKDPGAPKAKYTPRKPKAPEAPEVVREVVEVPVVVDDAHFARQVVSNIGQIRRDHFNARRENWRTMVSENYR